MDRRQFLASGSIVLGFSIAGCLTGELGRGDDTDASRVVSVESQSQDIADHEIAFEVEVVSPQLDDETPARVRKTVFNHSADDVRLLGGNRNVFGETSSDDADGLWLLSPGREDEAARSDDGCWMVEPPVGRTEELGQTQIDAGDSATVESDIYGETEQIDGNCPDEGTYHFGQSYTLETRADSDSEESQWERTDDFEWGFTLRVE